MKIEGEDIVRNNWNVFPGNDAIDSMNSALQAWRFPLVDDPVMAESVKDNARKFAEKCKIQSNDAFALMFLVLYAYKLKDYAKSTNSSNMLQSIREAQSALVVETLGRVAGIVRVNSWDILQGERDLIAKYFSELNFKDIWGDDSGNNNGKKVLNGNQKPGDPAIAVSEVAVGREKKAAIVEAGPVQADNSKPGGALKRKECAWIILGCAFISGFLRAATLQWPDLSHGESIGRELAVLFCNLGMASCVGGFHPLEILAKYLGSGLVQALIGFGLAYVVYAKSKEKDRDLLFLLTFGFSIGLTLLMGGS